MNSCSYWVGICWVIWKGKTWWPIEWSEWDTLCNTFIAIFLFTLQTPFLKQCCLKCFFWLFYHLLRLWDHNFLIYILLNLPKIVLSWCRCPMSQKQAPFWTHFCPLFNNIVICDQSIVYPLLMLLLWYINLSKTTKSKSFLSIIFVEITLKGSHPSDWPLVKNDIFANKQQ